MAQKNNSVDSGAVTLGFVVGLLVGGIVALFKAPKSGTAALKQLSETGQNIRSKLETMVPADPIAQSMAEGKAAAQRRRSELGLDQS